MIFRRWIWSWTRWVVASAWPTILLSRQLKCFSPRVLSPSEAMKVQKVQIYQIYIYYIDLVYQLWKLWSALKYPSGTCRRPNGLRSAHWFWRCQLAVMFALGNRGVEVLAPQQPSISNTITVFYMSLFTSTTPKLAAKITVVSMDPAGPHALQVSRCKKVLGQRVSKVFCFPQHEFHRDVHVRNSKLEVDVSGVGNTGNEEVQVVNDGKCEFHHMYQDILIWSFYNLASSRSVRIEFGWKYPSWKIPWCWTWALCCLVGLDTPGKPRSTVPWRLPLAAAVFGDFDRQLRSFGESQQSRTSFHYYRSTLSKGLVFWIYRIILSSRFWSTLKHCTRHSQVDSPAFAGFKNLATHEELRVKWHQNQTVWTP